MMHDVVNRIRSEMLSTFKQVFNWFDVDEQLLNHDPADGGWNIKQILEHISLTNHFLLILIDKGVRKSLDAAKKCKSIDDLDNYDLDWNKMEAIGQHKSFTWIRPEHMESKGIMSLSEVKAEMEKQLSDCLNHLDKIKNGEGVLYMTMMSVNGLGKIDVYHYIYFLIQHMKRHLTQMQKITSAFEQSDIRQ